MGKAKVKRKIIKKPNLAAPTTTKANQERMKKIILLIRAGNYICTAYMAVGICKQTYYNWYKKGRDAKRGPFREFVEGVDTASAMAEVWHVGNIRVAAQTSWQASAWWLERTRTTRFGKQTRHELTGEGGGPIQIEMTREDAERVLRKIEEPMYEDETLGDEAEELSLGEN